jgi:hypothetical protein
MMIFLLTLPLCAMCQVEEAPADNKWVRIRPGLTYNSMKTQGSQPLVTPPQIYFRAGLEFEYAFLPQSPNWSFALEPTYQYYTSSPSYSQPYQTFRYQSLDLSLSIRRYFPLKNEYRLFISAGSDINMPFTSEVVLTGTYGSGNSYENVYPITWKSALIVGGGYSISRFMLEVRNSYSGFSAILAYTLNAPTPKATDTGSATPRRPDYLRLRAGLTYQKVDIASPYLPSYGPDLGFRFGVEFEHQFPFRSPSWCVVLEPALQFYSSTGPVPFSTSKSTVEFKAIDFGLGLRHYFPSSGMSRLFLNAGTAFTLPISSRIYYSDDIQTYGSYDLQYSLPIIAGLGWSRKKLAVEARYTHRSGENYVGANYAGTYSGLELILAWAVIGER